MKIMQMELGPLGTNCYIIINEETKEALVIDPGAEGKKVLEILNKDNLVLKAIILTHGHSDHIGAVGFLAKETGAEVMISEKDASMLTDSRRNLSAYMGDNIVCEKADRLLNDGDKIDVAGITLDVIATPGHTPGGICLKTGDTVFCGDTIFCESIGRTDFPGGSYSEIINSIKTKILILPDTVKLLPGHGPATDVGWERRRNPFLQ